MLKRQTVSRRPPLGLRIAGRGRGLPLLSLVVLLGCGFLLPNADSQALAAGVSPAGDMRRGRGGGDSRRCPPPTVDHTQHQDPPEPRLTVHAFCQPVYRFLHLFNFLACRVGCPSRRHHMACAAPHMRLAAAAAGGGWPSSS